MNRYVGLIVNRPARAQGPHCRGGESPASETFSFALCGQMPPFSVGATLWTLAGGM